MGTQHPDPEFHSRDAHASDVAAAFRTAWHGDAEPSTATVELLPVRLTKACVSVLPVDGAGLSLHETGFRVPIGASDVTASLAERLQFTQGEGPCLDSARTRRALTVVSGEMETRWPSFAAELFGHTPYRAIVSLPVAITPNLFGALDLYFVDPTLIAPLHLPDAAAITAEIAEALAAAAVSGAVAPTNGEVGEDDGEDDDAVIPTWLDTEPAHNRTYVWVAMGMVMTQFGLSATDALAMLRSYSYGHDRLLDDVAIALMNGTLDLVQMQP